MTVRQISDEVCLAALRGWNGWAPDADLSKVQTAPETKTAWRRAISAALVALGERATDEQYGDDLDPKKIAAIQQEADKILSQQEWTQIDPPEQSAATDKRS